MKNKLKKMITLFQVIVINILCIVAKYVLSFFKRKEEKK